MQSAKDTTLNNIIGSLLLFIIIGFPFWLPMVLIFKDIIFNESGSLCALLSSNSVDHVSIVKKCMEYLVPFIPGVILLIWWKKTNVEESSGDSITLENLNIVSPPDYLNEKPAGITGKPQSNMDWIRLSDHRFKLKRHVNYGYVTKPLAVIGFLLWLLISIGGYSEHGLLSTANLGLWMLILSGGIHIVCFALFDIGLVVDIEEKKLLTGKLIISFSELDGLQLLAKQQTHINAGGEPYTVYEANLVLENKQRVNILNHGDIVKLIHQVSRLSDLVDCKIFMHQTVLEDIDAYNNTLS
ncbi:hypothetical protein [Bermanella sp. R86510]|uniref:hypothetical protein n=1 Tax=unclassified Bermanella TaxID=2627862 RepID=UPI0037CCA58A